MNLTFEEQVLSKLSSIENRLTDIEEQLEGATGLASSFMEGGAGEMLGGDMMNNLKDTLSSLMSPQMSTPSNAEGVTDPESIQDLVGSLQSFRDRLSGIKSAIADMPEEFVNPDGDSINSQADTE